MSNRPRRRRPRQKPQDELASLLAELAAIAGPASGPYRRLLDQAQPTGNADPRKLGGSIIGPGGPHDRGAVLLDSVRDGRSGGQMIYMTLSGRVNKTTDQVQVGYAFGPDGAAALITELLALADRAGADLLDDVTRRLTDLHQSKTVDLHWLRAAIDNVIADQEKERA